MTTSLVWFRRDLRLEDHLALTEATAQDAHVVPVYVWNPEDDRAWPPGGASRWYLQRSLAELACALEARGSRLVFARGDPATVLPQLAQACGARAVRWSRRYEPTAMRSDAVVESALRAAGLATSAQTGSLLSEPWEILGKGGGPYRIFTPYWKEFLARARVSKPLPAPDALRAPKIWPSGGTLQSLGIAPEAPWQRSLAAHWSPGESSAREALDAFASRPLRDYAENRDRTDLDAMSRLSPRLHHGELSPRQVWAAIGAASRKSGLDDATWRGSKFCGELIWREFAAQSLYHFPELPDRSFQDRFESLAWREAPADFGAWKRGRTGVAMVDAGMRELWETGWMHNRARMICASFLVKNLLIHWRDGARWFWDTLVDADLANNSINWQWVAGTGPDAAPWFRIFNPDTQADKFDPNGDYRRHWLGRDGSASIRPMVDLKTTRERALAAQRALREFP